MKRPRARLLAVVLVVLATGVCVIGYLWQATFGPGMTMEDTAQILIHDRKFGMRATQKAIEYGDGILPIIQTESKGFLKLDSRNSFWIAEVLGGIRTEHSRSILNDLYSRTNIITKLTGAIGLADHGALADPIGEESFLAKIVRNNSGETETQLAVIALGKTRDVKALPCLVDLLHERPVDYWHHAYACEAVVRIGSADAIPVLRDCLTSNEFHALAEAFRALIALGDREAVPLAIARVSPELRGFNSGFVVVELKRVTGKRLGYNRQKWEKWWELVKDRWVIPEKFRRPWDEQEGMY